MKHDLTVEGNNFGIYKISLIDKIQRMILKNKIEGEKDKEYIT